MHTSQAIYNVLLKHNYDRYIAVKIGTDRGAYDFYFFGQTQLQLGLLLYANKSEMILINLSQEEIDKGFSLVPAKRGVIAGYTGHDDVWSHLVCSYMQIRNSEYKDTLSFRDYLLIESGAEPASIRGVHTLRSVLTYFRSILQQHTENKSPDLSKLEVPVPTDLNITAADDVNIRKTVRALFYEIP